MLYLYNQKRLKPLRVASSNAISIADSQDTILVSNIIEEVINISPYKLSAFLLHRKNSSSLFRYWYLQLKNRTLREFHIIIYADKKNLLYFILKIASFLSFGNYKLIYFKKDIK